jgi:hypothetical protein
MSTNARPPAQAPAAPPLLRAPALALALACTLLAPGAPALAAGSLPWLAPGQQDNASASASNSSAPEAPAAAASATGSAAQAKAPAQQAAQPVDAAGQAQFEVLRQYFRRQMTLAEDFTEVFSRRVRDGETLAFLAMCQRQRSRGLLGRFRSAEVDISGLTFTRITADPDLARIRVTGRYSVTLGPKAPVAEDPKAPAAEGPKAAAAEDPKAGAAEQARAGATAEALVHETLEEDALFVLLPEMGEWKIYERREGWQP